MRDKIPNNVFIDEIHQKQMNDIIAFRDDLVAKNPLVFEDETVFIDLDFQFIAQVGKVDAHLSFEPKYSHNLPPDIKRQFEAYLHQFIQNKASRG